MVGAASGISGEAGEAAAAWHACRDSPATTDLAAHRKITGIKSHLSPAHKKTGRVSTSTTKTAKFKSGGHLQN